MKTSISFLTLFIVSLFYCAKAQERGGADNLYTPYKLNYLPAGSPDWMALMANPDGLNYNALIDSFNIYLRDNPEARRKSRDTKQTSQEPDIDGSGMPQPNWQPVLPGQK